MGMAMQAEQKPPIAVFNRMIPWTYDLETQSAPMPAVGTRAGPFTVALSKGDALMIKVAGLQSLITILGGLCIAIFAAFL